MLFLLCFPRGPEWKATPLSLSYLTCSITDLCTTTRSVCFHRVVEIVWFSLQLNQKRLRNCFQRVSLPKTCLLGKDTCASHHNQSKMDERTMTTGMATLTTGKTIHNLEFPRLGLRLPIVCHLHSP